MKKYGVIAVFIIASLLILASLEFIPVQGSSPIEMKKLRMVALEEPATVPIFLASKEGKFYEKNLNLDLELLESEEQVINAFVAGAADGALIEMEEVALFQEKGIYSKATSVFNAYNNISNDVEPGKMKVLAFSGESLENKREEIKIFHRVYKKVLERLAYSEYTERNFNYSLASLTLPPREEVTRMIKEMQKVTKVRDDCLYEDLVDTGFISN